MKINFSFEQTNDNKDWPLTIKFDGKNVTLAHDTQRDRDSISLTHDEWAYVIKTVNTMIDATQQVATVLNQGKVTGYPEQTYNAPVEPANIGPANPPPTPAGNPWGEPKT